MRSFQYRAILSLCLFACLISCKSEAQDEISIGMVVPLEHRAMTAITQGFTETLRQIYPNKKFQFHIANAQGDPNLMRAIIQQMRGEDYAMIVPIGMSTTQMTLAMTRKQPIVSLAADYREEQRLQQKPCHSAFVHDEISATQLIDFIHAVYPNMHHVTLIHSSADKILPQVQEAIAAGKHQNIEIVPIMVNSLSELYLAGRSVQRDTQAILILKDHAVVSGVPTLVKLAEAKHVPLIASDQGSVEAGASFALGVHERTIGVEGAMLAAQVLSGKNICSLPIVEMRMLTVFINKKGLQETDQQSTPLMAVAKKLHYTYELSGGAQDE